MIVLRRRADPGDSSNQRQRHGDDHKGEGVKRRGMGDIIEHRAAVAGDHQRAEQRTHDRRPAPAGGQQGGGEQHQGGEDGEIRQKRADEHHLRIDQRQCEADQRGDRQPCQRRQWCARRLLTRAIIALSLAELGLCLLSGYPRRDGRYRGQSEVDDSVGGRPVASSAGTSPIPTPCVFRLSAD
jgi:hypothetical protein